MPNVKQMRSKQISSIFVHSQRATGPMKTANCEGNCDATEVYFSL